MMVFFEIVAFLITLLLYAIFHFPIILYIGWSFVVVLILTSIYSFNIKANFYLQSTFVIVNTIVQLILLFVIPNPYYSGAVWMVYALGILSWMLEWMEHYSEYIGENCVRPMFRKHIQKYGELTEYDRKCIGYDVDRAMNFKFYLMCSPYLIFAILALAFKNDPDFGILVFFPLACVLFYTGYFWVSFKVKGIEPTDGANDKITSFAEMYKAGWESLVKFLKSIGAIFKKKPKNKSTSYKGFSARSTSTKGSSSKSTYVRSSPKKSKREFNFHWPKFTRKKRSRPSRSSYSSYSSRGSGEFSILRLVIPIVCFVLVLIFLLLETSSIVSGNVGNLSNVIADFVFEQSSWFVLAKLVIEHCFSTLNADTFIALLTFLPLAALYLALLIVAVVVDIALSIVYIVLGIVLLILAAILSFALAFVPGALAIFTVISAISTLKGRYSSTNKVVAGALLPAEIIACVGYFIILFSHQA